MQKLGHKALLCGYRSAASPTPRYLATLTALTACHMRARKIVYQSPNENVALKIDGSRSIFGPIIQLTSKPLN
jgi:hypothetical protein